MSETHTNQTKDSIAQLLDQLTAAGVTQEDIRTHAIAKHREAQKSVATPPPMADSLWAERKAWLLTDQQVHGTLDEFYWLALAALTADDQAEYSRQRDLIFAALRTMFGLSQPTPAAPTDNEVAK